MIKSVTTLKLHVSAKQITSQLKEEVEKHRFSLKKGIINTGWNSVFSNEDSLIFESNNFTVLKASIAKRSIPGPSLKVLANERLKQDKSCSDLSDDEVSSKLKEFENEIYKALLPFQAPRFSDVIVFFDHDNDLLHIAESSKSGVDNVISLIRNTVESLPAELIEFSLPTDFLTPIVQQLLEEKNPTIEDLEYEIKAPLKLSISGEESTVPSFEKYQDVFDTYKQKSFHAIALNLSIKNKQTSVTCQLDHGMKISKLKFLEFTATDETPTDEQSFLILSMTGIRSIIESIKSIIAEHHQGE